MAPPLYSAHGIHLILGATLVRLGTIAMQGHTLQLLTMSVSLRLLESACLSKEES